MAGNILIVDQNQNYREILRVLLERRGYAVMELEDGYQIDGFFENTEFDIVFLDSDTAGVRDKHLFAEIRNQYPYAYLILITSKRGNGLIREAMDSGVYGCISKPFNPEEILTMVHHLASNSKSNTTDNKKKKDR